MKRIVASLLSLLAAMALGGPVAAAPNGSNITLTGPALSVYAGPIEFLATIRDPSGNAVPNELVTWSFNGPVQIASATSITNASGVARIAVNPTNSNGYGVLMVSASIRTNTLVTLSRTIVGQFFSPVSSNFNLTLDAPSSTAPGKSLFATATLRTASGVPVPGVTINWRNSGVGFLVGNSGVTDSSGRVSTNLLFGSADYGPATLTATAVFSTFEVIRSVPINVGALNQMSVNIGQTNDRIRVEILGAQDSFILVEIDGSINLVNVTQNRQVVTFPAKSTRHFVSVFIDDVLYSQKTLTFPNLRNSQNKTITCRALDRVITVSAKKPTCPSPFKLSNTPMPANAKVTTCFKTGVTLRMAKPMTQCPPGYSR